MIEKAQKNYPILKFKVADARNFELSQSVDAVFSNAVLHWILETDEVIKSINKSLKTGGRFIAEFGGQGNIESIVQNPPSLVVWTLDDCKLNKVLFYC